MHLAALASKWQEWKWPPLRAPLYDEWQQRLWQRLSLYLVLAQNQLHNL